MKHISGEHLTKAASPKCRHCGLRRFYGRGLCKPCHTDPAVLAQYPPAGRVKVPCVHCALRSVYCRGLCRPCHADPVVSAQYPAKARRLPPGNSGWRREPTDAELDELVRQQMRCLPDWFLEEERVKLNSPQRDIKVTLTQDAKRAKAKRKKRAERKRKAGVKAVALRGEAIT